MFAITRKRLAGLSSARTMALVLVVMLASIASAQGPILHRVSVGSPDACGAFGPAHPGCEANYSLVAIQRADGSVSGRYADRSAFGGGFIAVVTCLYVDGNDAWISGVITQGTQAGLPVATRVRDNGVSARDPADQISYSFVGDTTACDEQPAYPLLDAPDGQVVVD